MLRKIEAIEVSYLRKFPERVLKMPTAWLTVG